MMAEPLPRLVVIGDHASDAHALLSPVIQSKVQTLRSLPPTPLSGLPLGVVGVAPDDPSGWHAMRIPFDGPAQAVHLAVQAIRDRLPSTQPRTLLVIEASPPPPPDVITQAASTGITPAIETGRSSWVLAHQAWVTGPGGIVTLRQDVRDPAQGVELARTLVALGLTTGNAPHARWIEQVAVGRTATSVSSWRAVLCAGYIEAVVQALEAADPGDTSAL